MSAGRQLVTGLGRFARTGGGAAVMERPRVAAAQEERQRKLQEYLAAKGKLKCPNTKPYLKDRTNRPNPRLPQLSKSAPVVRSKKDVPSKVSKCIPKDHAPTVRNPTVCPALQHRSSYVPMPQGPKSIPPSLLQDSSRTVQLNTMAPLSTCHPLNQIRETGKSENSGTVTDQKAVMLTQNGKDSQQRDHHLASENLQEKVDSEKENLPSKTILESSENRTESGLDPKVQSRTGINNPESKKGLVHRHTLGRAPKTNVSLKDRIITRQARKESIRHKRAKSPPCSKVICPERPSIKARGSVPPSQIAAVCRTHLSKKSGAEKQCLNLSVVRQNPVKLQADGMLSFARQPPHKPCVMPSGTCKTVALEAGKSKQKVRAGQDLKLTRSPISSCVSKRSSVMELKAKSKRTSERWDSKPSGVSSWRRNAARGKLQIHDLKKAAQTCGTKFKNDLPRNCPVDTPMSNTKGGVGMFRNTRETPKQELLRERETQDPKTCAVEKRKKQLEQWLASKGKSYKRPPMKLPAKRPDQKAMNLSFWKSLEEEEEREQLCLRDKIHDMLTECLELIEKGCPSEELFATLSNVPEAEKFAKFWICKAKLLAQNGNPDVTELYEAAVRAGAAPIQELRAVVVEFLKKSDQASQDHSMELAPFIPENAGEEPGLQGPRSPSPGTGEQATTTPYPTVRFLPGKTASLVKLQVVPVPRCTGLPGMQDLKFLTPVRRSLRIERAHARYPEMLWEHDTVVSSLDEILAGEGGSQFIFCKNEALPEEDLELQGF